MPGSTFDKIKEGILERRLAGLSEEYEALDKALNSSISPVARLRIEREMKDKEDEIVRTEQELRQFNVVAGDYNQRYQEWSAHFPQIDFHKAARVFQKTFGRIEQGGAALFILQNSNAKGGEWCVQRIHSFLSDRTGDFKHYTVGFSFNTRSYIFDFLYGMNQYLQNAQTLYESEPTQEDLVRYTEVVITNLCNSLRSGSIVFIELKQCDHFCRQHYFFDWFFAHFWGFLTQKLEDIARDYPRVKIVILMVVDSKISQSYLPQTLFLSKGRFDDSKIVDLPLQHCSRTDIQRWLENYSGLRLTRDEIARKVEIIYSASENGNPVSVYRALMTYL